MSWWVGLDREQFIEAVCERFRFTRTQERAAPMIGWGDYGEYTAWAAGDGGQRGNRASAVERSLRGFQVL